MENGRILYIFTPRSIISTVAGGIIGIVLSSIFSMFITSKWLGIIIIAIFAAIGYAITTLRVPDSNNFYITRKTGGEKLDDVILRAIKFKMRGKRIYLYTKEEYKK